MQRGVKPVDAELPLDVRVRNWVATNYKHILVFSMLLSMVSVLGAFFVVIRSQSIMATQNRIIHNLSDKVIFVRADGRVAVLEKAPLGEQTLRYVLRDLVANKVVLSAMDIYTQGVSELKKMDKVPKVKVLLGYFDKDSPGYSGYIAYLSTILSSYIANNLPEVIQPVFNEYFAEDLRYQDGQFDYTVVLPVVYTYALAQRWNTASGSIRVRLMGRINLPDGTPENPFGIKIESFKVEEYVAKKSPY